MRRNFFSHLGPRHGRNPVIEDPRHFIAERSMRDERVLSVVSFLDRAAYAAAVGSGDYKMMADGTQYRDTRQPNMVVAQSSITLAATDKLLTPGALTALVANYWWPGKLVKQTIIGAFTTAATPGNLGVEIYTGASATTDAGGTLAGSSAAVALTANKTNAQAVIEAWGRCRSTGATGTVLASARFMSDGAFLLTASASNPVLTPQSGIAATTIDTTQAGGFNVQIKRSGSTAETFVTHDLIFEALN